MHPPVNIAILMPQHVMAENERLAGLDEEVSALRAEIASLRSTIEEVKALFG